MPEHPGFELRQVDGRSMVQLRVRPNGAHAAIEGLQLPRNLVSRSGEPSVCWLGPELWLLSSNSRTADDMIAEIDQALSGQLYAAVDMSSNYVCFGLEGKSARTVLAMGCGIDMHRGAFVKGQCVRTHFANVMLLIVAVGDNHFDLYADRSYARYLNYWISNAGEDPITHESNTVS